MKKWEEQEDIEMFKTIEECTKEGKTLGQALKIASEKVGRSVSACRNRFNKISAVQAMPFDFSNPEGYVKALLQVHYQNIELTKEIHFMKQQVQMFIQGSEKKEKRRIGFI